jgi:HTH-type transcriptional regulator/antitoxin HigA
VVVINDPVPNTSEFDELELLAFLIEKYDAEHSKIEIPDPIEAIKFRMEQQNLKNSDLVPFIGSKSKVSEVLNRKRALSLSMIRKLNHGLGIPAEVLIKDTFKSLPDEIEGIEWNKFPLGEMIKKGWIEFSGTTTQAKEYAEELIRKFFSQSNSPLAPNLVFFRKSIRSDTQMDEYALYTWYQKVLIDQNQIQLEKHYEQKFLNHDFFKDLRRLSIFDEGPLLAKEYLGKYGIKLVVVPHLTHTKLDGATFLNHNTPIICLTLRYDRLDYFWFTLFHELAHLKLHLVNSDDCFFDDLKSKSITDIEIEADIFAEDQLIPRDKWSEFYSPYISEEELLEFSNDCKISPAIIAGRIQKEREDFKIFRKHLGQGQVKKQFSI